VSARNKKLIAWPDGASETRARRGMRETRARVRHSYTHTDVAHARQRSHYDSTKRPPFYTISGYSGEEVRSPGEGRTGGRTAAGGARNRGSRPLGHVGRVDSQGDARRGRAQGLQELSAGGRHVPDAHLAPGEKHASHAVWPNLTRQPITK